MCFDIAVDFLDLGFTDEVMFDLLNYSFLSLLIDFFMWEPMTGFFLCPFAYVSDWL